jgi:tripartite-type tricarboxylate transporter receptor subunit TctC
MRLDFRSPIAGLTLTAAAFALPAPAGAQTGDYFAGKTLRVIVGLEAGGTADVFVRGFSVQLRKHVPSNPVVVVQNMTAPAARLPPTTSMSAPLPTA